MQTTTNPAEAAVETNPGVCAALCPPTSARGRAGGIGAPPGASAPASGPQRPPADLLRFVAGNSLSRSAQLLGVSRGTVNRLRAGYWPTDARRIVRAWDQYKARSVAVSLSWLTRRVRAGGVVRHAGADYSAPDLLGRAGQMLALARTADGLLAQTLELPSCRFMLEPRP